MWNLAHRNRSDFCDLRLRCPSQTPEIARFLRQDKAMLHCDLRVRWKVASDLRFRAAISEPKAPSFCGISGDLAQSTRKSLAIAIVRFWCAKMWKVIVFWGGIFCQFLLFSKNTIKIGILAHFQSKQLQDNVWKLLSGPSWGLLTGPSWVRKKKKQTWTR